MKRITFNNLPDAAQVNNNEGSQWAILQKLNADNITNWNTKSAEFKAGTITEAEWDAWLDSDYLPTHYAIMAAQTQAQDVAKPGPYWNSGRGVTLANCVEDI